MTASAGINAATGFTSEPTIASELICAFDVIQDKELAEIEAANYSLSQPLALVLGNWNKTRSTFVASAPGEQDFEVQLFNTDLAHSLLITCKKVNTDAQLQNLGKFINIPSVNPVVAGGDGASAANGRVLEPDAQWVEGYGQTITTAIVGTVAAAAAGSRTAVSNTFVGRPLTNKHSIPWNTTIQTTNGTAINYGTATATAQLDAGTLPSR